MRMPSDQLLGQRLQNVFNSKGLAFAADLGMEKNLKKNVP